MVRSTQPDVIIASTQSFSWESIRHVCIVLSVTRPDRKDSPLTTNRCPQPVPSAAVCVAAHPRQQVSQDQQPRHEGYPGARCSGRLQALTECSGRAFGGICVHSEDALVIHSAPHALASALMSSARRPPKPHNLCHLLSISARLSLASSSNTTSADRIIDRAHASPCAPRASAHPLQGEHRPP